MSKRRGRPPRYGFEGGITIQRVRGWARVARQLRALILVRLAAAARTIATADLRTQGWHANNWICGMGHGPRLHLPIYVSGDRGTSVTGVPRDEGSTT